MKKISKEEEPKFYLKFIKKKKSINWDDLKPIKADLKKHILEKEEKKQCAYCESAITLCNLKSYRDLFKRKHYFAIFTIKYSVIILKVLLKKNKEVIVHNICKSIVNSAEENPEHFFEYYISGKIISKSEKAKFTENVLNLFHQSLIQQRRGVTYAVFA